MLSPAYMEQQLSREFAKARRTLTVRPILGLLKVFAEIYFLIDKGAGKVMLLLLDH